MKLSEVLAQVPVSPAVSSKHKGEVTGIANDSRKVKAGDMFVALPGTKVDGANYAADAVKQGAVAVVAQVEVPGLTVPTFKVDASAKALALIASNFYGRPTQDLSLLGITGTNGKTTTAYLLESICSSAGAFAGLIGTVEYRYGGKSYDATHTTPDALSLHRLFKEMVDDDVDTVVMEVSSHALVQERVHGLTFRAAAFTNLSRDHLDFHKDLEEYFQAKRRLFTEFLSPTGVAVVNGDDTYGTRIYNEFKGQKRAAWKFSRRGEGELSAAGLELTTTGIKGTLKTPAGDIPIKSSLIGGHNLENIMCAAGMALGAGYSRKDVQEGIERLRRVPGRMERVEGRGGVVALVDYAHTDDALRKALESARALTRGKLITVFGCGGDRDTGKRPLMGAAAAELSDLPIVTSDNPRSEDPDDIISEILPGIEKAGLRRMGAAKAKQGEKGYLVEADRAEAIKLAVTLAQPGDIVLIAGKGHEAYQQVGTEKHPFDDLKEAEKALGG
jgi:UDP-N-acetylmuramoyl-L-alanyl-D-glutamate--2,6-diaminopimelate ligase